MPRQVKVEMVVMVAIGVRTEHCREILAGAAVERPQEHRLTATTTPATLQRNDAPIAEFKRGNVYCVRAAMLGELITAFAIDGAAGIRRDHADALDGRSQMADCRRGHNAAGPFIKRRHHGAAERCSGRQPDATAIQRRHFKRADRAASTDATGRAAER